ncbi:MAG: hypothetical protein WBB76_06305 [Gaiellaceae bacterium]
MRTTAGFSVLALLGLTVAACNGGGKNISTHATADSLRSAGFHRLVIHPGKGYDVIARKGRLKSFAPVQAVRFSSSSRAKKIYEVGYSRQAVKAAVADLRHKGYGDALPRGFELRNFESIRVCNVIVSTYNAYADPSLDARLRRAAALHRKACQ